MSSLVRTVRRAMERANKMQVLAAQPPKQLALNDLMRACDRLIALNVPRAEILKAVEAALVVGERK